ncbi:MAG: ABC transporter permease [Marinibacterium sp.]
MQENVSVFAAALRLILDWDPDLIEVIALSMRVTLGALVLSCLVGFPIGAALGALRFPGRGALRVLFSSLMGLPPVVVGLSVYLMLSASGPLGPLGLLYTPTAMVLAQTVLITPIVAALTCEAVAGLFAEYKDHFASLGVGPIRRLTALLRDARFGLVTVALAGFGRAVAEVGAVMIVGGNINHATRVMTTTIALETSKGDLQLALALGAILLTISLAVNAALSLVRKAAEGLSYA